MDWWEETAWQKQKSFVSFHWQPSAQSQYAEAKWSTVNLCGFGDSGSLAFCTIPRYPEKQGKRPRQRLQLTGSAVWGVQRKAAPFTLTESHQHGPLDLRETSRKGLLTEYYFIWLKAVTVATHAAWHLERTAWEWANVLKLFLLI